MVDRMTRERLEQLKRLAYPGCPLKVDIPTTATLGAAVSDAWEEIEACWVENEKLKAENADLRRELDYVNRTWRREHP